MDRAPSTLALVCVAAGLLRRAEAMARFEVSPSSCSTLSPISSSSSGSRNSSSNEDRRYRPTLGEEYCDVVGVQPEQNGSVGDKRDALTFGNVRVLANGV